jgi:cytochrome c556
MAMKFPLGRCIVVVAAIAAVTGVALSHGGATGVVKERMDGMLNLGGAVKALSTAFENANPNLSEVKNAATVILAHSGEKMTALFPLDSLDKPSQGTEQIWKNWNEFFDLAIELERLGTELEAAANSVSSPSPTPIRSTATSQDQTFTWDSLDERVLLGLPSKPEFRVSDPPPSSSPSIEEIFSQITDTCASCHQQFRRGKS